MRGKITECRFAETESIFFLNHVGTIGNQEGMIA